MLILALETATDPGSVALWRDGEVIARSCPERLSNSETLLPQAAETLRELGLTFADVQGIAFGMGPGALPVILRATLVGPRSWTSVESCAQPPCSNQRL